MCVCVYLCTRVLVYRSCVCVCVCLYLPGFRGFDRIFTNNVCEYTSLNSLLRSLRPLLKPLPTSYLEFSTMLAPNRFR
jgi:hypothetical protein